MIYFVSARLYRVLYCDASWPPRWALARAREVYASGQYQ